MRTMSRSRAFCALIVFLLLLSLCACGRSDAGPEATEAPLPDPGPEPGDGEQGRRWKLSYDASDELLRRLGYDPGVSGPLTAALTLTLGNDGRCALRADYSACAEPLQIALSDYLRAVQNEEAGRSLSEAELAEALGAGLNDAAAAIVDELLPSAAPRAGQLSDARDAIVWDDGSRSAIWTDGEGLWVELPLEGTLRFFPAN